MGELEDRCFMLVDEATGKFITARQKPRLVRVQGSVENGILTCTVPGKPQVTVDLKKIVKERKVIRAS